MRKFSSLVLISTLFLLVIGCAGTAPKRVDTKTNSANREVKENSSPEAMDYVLRAATAESSGEIWQAIVLYRLAADYDTNSATILQSLSEVYLRANETNAARNAIDRAYDIDPKNSRTLEIRCSICLLERDAVSLGNTLRQWSAIAENDSSQIGKVAGMYFMVGDHIHAKQLYQNAIKKFGPREIWLDKLSALYIMEKNWKEASSVMGQLADYDAGNVQRWLDAGEAALASGDTTLAQQRTNRAISIDPSDARGWRTAILIASVEGDSVRADSLVDAGYQANPNSPDLIGFKATKLQRQKKFNDAFDLLQKAITIDSTRLSLYVDLGFLAHTLDRQAVAETAYVHALRLDSTVALVLNNYAYLLATQNRELDKAKDMVTRALDREPENASYLDTRGWIQYRLGKYEDAITDLVKAAQIDSSNGEIQSHLGDVYSAKGDKVLAQSAWKKALELDPTLSDIKRKLETGKP